MEKKAILEKAFTVASNNMGVPPLTTLSKELAHQVIMNEMKEYLKAHDVSATDDELIAFINEKSEEVEKAILDYKIAYDHQKL